MILDYIKVGAENAQTIHEIQSQIYIKSGVVIKIPEIRKLIKGNRSSGIIWNNKGSYIEPNNELRKEFINKRVIPAMFGFNNGMRRVSKELGSEVQLKLK